MMTIDGLTKREAIPMGLTGTNGTISKNRLEQRTTLELVNTEREQPVLKINGVIGRCFNPKFVMTTLVIELVFHLYIVFHPIGVF